MNDPAVVQCVEERQGFNAPPLAAGLVADALLPVGLKILHLRLVAGVQLARPAAVAHRDEQRVRFQGRKV